MIPPSDDEEEDSPLRKKIAVSSSKSSAPKPRPSTSKSKAKKYQAHEDYDMASPQDSSASEDDDQFIEDDEIKPHKSKSKSKSKGSDKKPLVASSSKTKIAASNLANGVTVSQDAPKPNKMECVSFLSIFTHILNTTFVVGLPKKQRNWRALSLMALKKFPMAHQIASPAFHSFLLEN